jgi:hypothetical protein
MAKGKSRTNHHCPGAKTSGSNCRFAETPKVKKQYCTSHQTYCKICPEEYTFMLREDCKVCLGNRPKAAKPEGLKIVKKK